MTPLEIRRHNRFVLSPQGKRMCTRCKSIHPETKEFYPIRYTKHKGKRVISGFKTICKPCISKEGQESYQSTLTDPLSYCKRQLAQLKHRNRARGVELNLTPEDLIALLAKQDHKCYWSGEAMSFDHEDPNERPSIDRIDSSLPYSLDNIAWAKWQVNRMKNDLPVSRFLYLCNTIAKRHL